MTSINFKNEWEIVQNQFADLPGDAGIQKRCEVYAPFFLRFGREVRIVEGCRFYHPDRICLGDGVGINREALLYGSGGIDIGHHTLIGPRCFIHSANHDIAPAPEAFIERGYTEKQVIIGDNVLISAEVKILAGSAIGYGSFVACGTVVPGKIFPPDSKLIGPVAKPKAKDNRSPSPPAIPEIAIVCPAGSAWVDAAKHLLLPLGLPQVGIFVAGEPASVNDLPDSVSQVLVIGPEGWSPDLPGLEIPLWRLADGETTVSDRSLSFSTPFGDTASLPSHTPRFSTPSRATATDPPAEQLAHVLFWLLTRLNKAAGQIPDAELLAWLTALASMAPAGKEGRRLTNLVLDGLHASSKESGMVLPAERPPEDPHRTILTALKDTLVNFGFITSAEKHIPDDEAKLVPPDHKDFARLPAIAVAWVICTRNEETANSEGFRQWLEKLKTVAINSYRLVALEIAARLGGDQEFAEQIGAQLCADEWCDPTTPFPKVTPNKEALCYSPLIAAAMYMRWRDNIDDPLIIDPEVIEAHNMDKLSWSLFTCESPEWRLHGNTQTAIVNEAAKRISRSLLTNWLELHSAPCPKAKQWQLGPQSYSRAIAELETAWLAVFRRMLSLCNRPMLRLRPWPAGYRAAISLRYDVDRPVSAERIDEIVEIQRKHLNGPCASWYYFADDNKRSFQSRQHKRTSQELGVHALQASDAIKGEGVTHHSAPTSDYWQGDRTTHALNDKAAGYGEFLATRFGTSRLAWLADNNVEEPYGRLGRLWLSPLHFPLEGSTSEKTLEYFDRLRNPFRAAVADGDHIIIGSHPDLNQEILVELFQREEMSDLWPVTVAAAIDRVRTVFAPGAVRIVDFEDGNPRLWSRDGVADLVIEIYHQDIPTVTFASLQLMPGQARVLELDKDNLA